MFIHLSKQYIYYFRYAYTYTYLSNIMYVNYGSECYITHVHIHIRIHTRKHIHSFTESRCIQYIYICINRDDKNTYIITLCSLYIAGIKTCAYIPVLQDVAA
jgi:hypothetical protein